MVSSAAVGQPRECTSGWAAAWFVRRASIDARNRFDFHEEIRRGQGRDTYPGARGRRRREERPQRVANRGSLFRLVVDDVDAQGHDILETAPGLLERHAQVAQGLAGLLAQVLAPDDLPGCIPGRLTGDVDGPASAADDHLREAVRDAWKESWRIDDFL